MRAANRSAGPRGTDCDPRHTHRTHVRLALTAERRPDPRRPQPPTSLSILRITLPARAAALAIPITATAAAVALAAPDTAQRAGAERLVDHVPGVTDRWPGTPRRSRPAPRPQPPRLRFPVRGRADYGQAIARFGVARGGHTHGGQDVFAAPGTPLVAVSDGVVVEAGGGDARGNHVLLYDRRHRRTYVYFHMQSPTRLEPGDRVRAGQRVGRVGCTGRCTGPHLHFEVREGRGADGEPRDPLPLLKRWRSG